MYYIICAFFIIIPIVIIPFIILKFVYKNKAFNLIKQIKLRLESYKNINLGMSEQKMLDIMNCKFDKSISEEQTIYRFVYVTKGGLGNITGSFVGATNTAGINQYGSIQGSQETHDESVVIIKCKDNKVIEVNPYNMNNINFPTEYGKLKELAANMNIDC